MELRIKDIRYSQNSINDYFGCGRTFGGLCSDLLSGRVTVESLPRISVVQHEGNWMAIEGNRRLFVLKRLHAHGKLGRDTIPVNIGFHGKNITATDGLSIEVRGNPYMVFLLDTIIKGYY